MCSGALMPKLLLFSLPLMLSGILQLFFNAADMVVIGRFSETEEIAELGLAAIGATASLTNFFINVIIGVSVGSNVMVARYFGAKRDRDVHDAVHTSLMLCIILGFAVGIAAIFLCRPILILMGTPEDVLPLAVRYIRIYFCGLPVIMLYNFGSAILRAVGDTRRPLYFLAAAGVLNVGLNLFFVIVCRLDVAGVAIATVISQALSAFLVLWSLMRTDSIYRVRLRSLRINGEKLKMILRIGLPAGLQGAVFSFSNVLIQSSVNSFGEIAVAGNSAALNLEGFVYMAMNAFSQAGITFTSQNYGARKMERIPRVIFTCVACVVITGLAMGNLFYLLHTQLLGIYTSHAQTIVFGTLRMKYICILYCFCGLMDVLAGCIRGLGYSIVPMIVSLLGACAFRIVWLYTFFRASRTLETLYLSYPVSWVITAAAHFVCLLIIWKKLRRPAGGDS